MNVKSGKTSSPNGDPRRDNSGRRPPFTGRPPTRRPEDFINILLPHPNDPASYDTPGQASQDSLPVLPAKRERRRQKKTAVACLPCQRSHYPCDEGRPCQSCMRRGRPAQCVDGLKKRAKYLELAIVPGEDGEWNAHGRTSQRKRPTTNEEETDEETASDRLRPLADSITHLHPGIAVSSANSGAPYAHPTEDPLVVTPFNYASGYHRILESLQRRLSGDGMSRVCQAFARFRPSLIAHLRTLSETDLALMERLFQRTIMELQTILPLTGAPHVVWRRTGEVAWTSAEFALLTGWSPSTLADGRRTIFGILGERAIVTYWEQYAMCVLEKSQTAFRVLGPLLRPDGRALPGAWWVTVRKDIFDIPLAVVGCFLPDLWCLMEAGMTSTGGGLMSSLSPKGQTLGGDHGSPFSSNTD